MLKWKPRKVLECAKCAQRILAGEVEHTTSVLVRRGDKMFIYHMEDDATDTTVCGKLHDFTKD